MEGEKHLRKAGPQNPAYLPLVCQPFWLYTFDGLFALGLVRTLNLPVSLLDESTARVTIVAATSSLPKQLETVPGVGPIVGLTAVAVFAEVSRFENAKQAASYAGLVPSTFQSGERDALGRITKRGSAELRAMLCEAAHVVVLPFVLLNVISTNSTKRPTVLFL